MARSARLPAYSDPAPVPWLMDATALLNRHLILPHVLRVRRIDLPAVDAARFARALDPDAAAFVAPNHPEFSTDWMLDKELSRRFAPRMAHWAAWEILHAVPFVRRLWMGLNLIANLPGGGGRAYSMRWARAGQCVLLHPEGTATWCGDRIAPLVPGVAEMAIAAWRAEQEKPSGAQGSPRPVFVAPVIWRLHFERDVGPALGREIDLVARGLHLPRPEAGDLAGRFAALHADVLARRCRRFGWNAPLIHPGNFFEAQAAFRRFLIGRLSSRHGAPGTDLWRWLRAIRRRTLAAERTEQGRADLDAAREIDRLHRFDPDVYGAPTLTQEQIAESLQRMRGDLLHGGVRNAIHAVLPRAVAPRIARIRVPEPLEAAAFDGHGAEAATRLLEALAHRMAGRLDKLREEIEPIVGRYRRPCPWRAPHRRPVTTRRFVTPRAGTAA